MTCNILSSPSFVFNQYLAAMTNWINSWKKNGFRTANGGDVKNKEDIVKLHNLCQKINVKWVSKVYHLLFTFISILLN